MATTSNTCIQTLFLNLTLREKFLGSISVKNDVLSLLPLFFIPSYFLKRWWFIEYSSQNWKTVSMKPEPMDLPLRLESCLHPGWVMPALTVLGWTRKMLERFKMCDQVTSFLMLHPQRRLHGKLDFLELNSATAKRGHRFSALFKDSQLMYTHYFVYISQLKIYISHRLTPQNVGMQLPPCRAIMHVPLGKRSGANQHDSSCNHVGHMQGQVLRQRILSVTLWGKHWPFIHKWRNKGSLRLTYWLQITHQVTRFVWFSSAFPTPYTTPNHRQLNQREL